MRAVQTGRTKGTCDGRWRLHGGLGRQGDKTTSVERLKKNVSVVHLGATPEPGRWSQAVYGSMGLCTDAPQTHGRYWRSGDYISGKLWSHRAGDRGTKVQR